MLVRHAFVSILLVSALFVSACSAPPPAPAPAISSQPQVTITTNPNPPTASGETELLFDVKDANGKALNGAELTVLADMIGMGMGMMQGKATDQGNGRYATKVPFSMAGDWKVTVELRQGNDLLVRQDFTLPVK